MFALPVGIIGGWFLRTIARILRRRVRQAEPLQGCEKFGIKILSRFVAELQLSGFRINDAGVDQFRDRLAQLGIQVLVSDSRPEPVMARGNGRIVLLRGINRTAVFNGLTGVCVGVLTRPPTPVPLIRRLERAIEPRRFVR